MPRIELKENEKMKIESRGVVLVRGIVSYDSMRVKNSSTNLLLLLLPSFSNRLSD